MSPADGFFARPFDDGTLTKLRLFQLYTREWLPVFLSRPEPSWRRLHIYDFFAGPGADSTGVPGSLEVEPWHFDYSFAHARDVLADRNAAKLVLIDQFGVDDVSDDRFKELAAFPTCDTLFFISSMTLHRFHNHPAIKQKIRRPNDYYHVHREVVNYYRTLLPSTVRYYLGGFSIKKGPNIYGVIFGSSHPLGMDKFLHAAWKADEVNGEANYDINRDDCGPLLSSLLPSTKMTAFETELANQIRLGAVKNEADVIEVCFRHGVKRQHAQPTLSELKAKGVIECNFRVPDIARLREPRVIRLSNQ